MGLQRETTAPGADLSLGEGRRALARAAVVLATRVLGELRGRGVYLLGGGPLAEAALLEVARHRPKRLTVARAPPAGWRDADAALPASSAPCGHRRPLLEAEADLVLTALAVPRPLFTRERISEVMRRRRHRPLVLIDLSPQPAVAPDAGTVAEAYAFDLRDLERLQDCAAQRRDRARPPPYAEDAGLRWFESRWMARVVRLIAGRS